MEGEHVFRTEHGRGTEVDEKREISPRQLEMLRLYIKLACYSEDWKTDELFGSRGSMEFSGYDNENRLLL